MEDIGGDLAWTALKVVVAVALFVACQKVPALGRLAVVLLRIGLPLVLALAAAMWIFVGAQQAFSTGQPFNGASMVVVGGGFVAVLAYVAWKGVRDLFWPRPRA